MQTFFITFMINQNSKIKLPTKLKSKLKSSIKLQHKNETKILPFELDQSIGELSSSNDVNKTNNTQTYTFIKSTNITYQEQSDKSSQTINHLTTQNTQTITIKPAQTNWKRELGHSFKSPMELLHYLDLEPSDFGANSKSLLKNYQFPMIVTKFFVDLIEKKNINDPLLKQILPVNGELIERDDFILQPLDEQDQFVPVKNIVHKYKDRLLFMPRGSCAINCRYCFRRNFPYNELVSSKSEWSLALDYAYEQNIKELILSGGDPLMMSDQEFNWLAEQLIIRNQNIITTKTNNTSIHKILRLRIHSRLPVVLPQRINNNFIETCQYLLQHNIKVILVTHINHPNEISDLLSQKIKKILNLGVVVLNQSVLLKDVNDNAQTLALLSEKLFVSGIMPYYLHLLDKVKGAVHFYVEEDKAHQIYYQLQTLLSGYLVPKLAREEVGRPFKTLYGTDSFKN